MEALRGGLRADDTIRLTGFDGTLHPLAAPVAPSTLDVRSLFSAIKYEGKATFFAPLWFDLAARLSVKDASSIMAVVITDGESDPLDLKARDRPTVADPTWMDAPPTVIGTTPVFWVVRDAPVKKGRVKAGESSPIAVPDRTHTARWQEPAGIESSLVAWNVPTAWTPGAEGLIGWIEAARPALPPPPPEPPPFNWAPILSLAKKLVGALAVLVAGAAVAVFVRRKAQQAGAAVAEKLGERQAERVLRGQVGDERVLRVEPKGTGGKQEERRVRPGDHVDVGPAAVPGPGVTIPGIPGSGFSLLLGRRPDHVQIRPRGSRPAVALLRAGNVIPVARESILDVRDGDLVIDARDETPLVRIRLPSATVFGRSA